MASAYVLDGYVAPGYVQAGISIDWLQKIIFVPKFFLTWLGGTNYSMDTNAFRIALKDIEDSEQGQVHPPTHNHNTEVSLGGLIYARVIEMINGYTVTFEDGNYSVSLIGSNNNILDVTNLNSVAVRSNNSAGLMSMTEIQYNTFNGGVTVDVLNGAAGTLYPYGTPKSPVNNFADATTIAAGRGFSSLFVKRSATLDAGADIDGYTIVGRSAMLVTLTLLPAANVQDCIIRDCTVTGTLDGGTMVERCVTGNLTYINGIIYSSMLNPGTITLGGDSSNEAHFLSCYAGKSGGPVIDCAGDGPTLLMRDYNGTVTLTNKTGNAPIVIDLNSGKVVLDTTVTSGHIVVRGLGEVVDTLGNVIPSGAWNGCTIDNDTVTSNTDIAEAVMAQALTSPMAVNVVQMNGATVYGNGSEADKWRGAGV